MKFIIICIFIISACSKSGINSGSSTIDVQGELPAFFEKFGSKIDLNNPANYSDQEIPAYITKDNTIDNPITNKGAILGRILFYDKELSSDRSISCSSCHQQENGFSDIDDASTGVNGSTGRHSMRLVNSRFSNESKFFWDERAQSLEEQTTQPIQDHNEMGFSGTLGDQDINDLIERLNGIDYYQELFKLVYGDSAVTEERMQDAMAQFIRSIQSFDSRYDEGRANVNNDNTDFSNFTVNENEGKRIFVRPPPQGGAGCAGCHSPPEFDIDPNSGNNGVIGSIAGPEDLSNTRAPSLRDLVNTSGESNGSFMHDASLSTIAEVIEHYNSGVVDNASLDNRLRGGGTVQNLGLSALEKTQLESFLKTLSGSNIYTDDKWSDPF